MIRQIILLVKNENPLMTLKKQFEQVYSISLGELIENQHEFDGFLNCSEQGHINTPANPFDGLKLNSNQWSFDVFGLLKILSLKDCQFVL